MNFIAKFFHTKNRDRFIVTDGEKERTDQLYYEVSGSKRRAHRTWYRGRDVNYHPVRKSLAEKNAFAKYIGLGWLPPEPFIDKDTYITAFGSCFAAELTKFLYSEGYKVFGRNLDLNAHVVRSGEGIVNSSALRQQFEWAYQTSRPDEGMWHGPNGEELSTDTDQRDTTAQVFSLTDVFIFTLGLSEIWYNKENGEAFWRGIPSENYDERIHSLKVLSPQENLNNLQRVYELIRINRPNAAVIFTISPVPLAATFRPVSCVTANSVSKASLRVAVDELMRRYPDDQKLFYFPSYEVVTTICPDPMEDDLRHPRRSVIKWILEEFRSAYLT